MSEVRLKYIEEEAYMSFPDGISGNPEQVLILNKSIYGLRSSPRNWKDKFNQFTEQQNFLRSKDGCCLYVKNKWS